MFQTFSVISLVYFSRSPKPFSTVLERKQRERRVGGKKGKERGKSRKEKAWSKGEKEGREGREVREGRKGKEKR